NFDGSWLTIPIHVCGLVGDIQVDVDRLGGQCGPRCEQGNLHRLAGAAIDPCAARNPANDSDRSGFDGPQKHTDHDRDQHDYNGDYANGENIGLIHKGSLSSSDVPVLGSCPKASSKTSRETRQRFLAASTSRTISRSPRCTMTPRCCSAPSRCASNWWISPSMVSFTTPCPDWSNGVAATASAATAPSSPSLGRPANRNSRPINGRTIANQKMRPPAAAMNGTFAAGATR